MNAAAKAAKGKAVKARTVGPAAGAALNLARVASDLQQEAYAALAESETDGAKILAAHLATSLKPEAFAALCDHLGLIVNEKQGAEQKRSKNAPTLQTERDGRLFAMDALERLQNADADEASAYPHPNGPVYASIDAKPWRTGPQWDGFYHDLMQLKFGTHAAVKGFACIATCALAGDIGINIDYFRKLERAGNLLPFGTPGTKYKAPKVQRKTKAMLKAERMRAAELRLASAQETIITALARHDVKAMSKSELASAAKALLKAGYKTKQKKARG